MSSVLKTIGEIGQFIVKHRGEIQEASEKVKKMLDNNQTLLENETHTKKEISQLEELDRILASFSSTVDKHNNEVNEIKNDFENSHQLFDTEKNYNLDNIKEFLVKFNNIDKVNPNTEEYQNIISSIPQKDINAIYEKEYGIEEHKYSDLKQDLISNSNDSAMSGIAKINKFKDDLVKDFDINLNDVYNAGKIGISIATGNVPAAAYNIYDAVTDKQDDIEENRENRLKEESPSNEKELNPNEDNEKKPEIEEEVDNPKDIAEKLSSSFNGSPGNEKHLAVFAQIAEVLSQARNLSIEREKAEAIETLKRNFPYETLSVEQSKKVDQFYSNCLEKGNVSSAMDFTENFISLNKEKINNKSFDNSFEIDHEKKQDINENINPALFNSNSKTEDYDEEIGLNR